MSIGLISNLESGSSVRTKINAAIVEANKVDDKLEDVGAADLKNELKASAAISASNVDWSAGAIFTKTLTGSTTLTFSNVVLNKTITLLISGNYTLVLPASVKIILGEYDGMTVNYIQFHCVNSSTPVFWATISQEAV